MNKTKTFDFIFYFVMFFVILIFTITIVSLGLGIDAFYGSANDYQRYGELTIEYLPVSCYDYFGIDIRVGD